MDWLAAFIWDHFFDGIFVLTCEKEEVYTRGRREKFLLRLLLLFSVYCFFLMVFMVICLELLDRVFYGLMIYFYS